MYNVIITLLVIGIITVSYWIHYLKKEEECIQEFEEVFYQTHSQPCINVNLYKKIISKVDTKN